MGRERYTTDKSPEEVQAMQDAHAEATMDWIDGYRTGLVQGQSEGYESGLDAGWLRGRDDILYQLKRLTKDSYDPELEQIVKEITGDY